MGSSSCRAAQLLGQQLQFVSVPDVRCAMLLHAVLCCAPQVAQERALAGKCGNALCKQPFMGQTAGGNYR
jgi:hypothetical protein